jgi:hypothetical protein
MATAGRNAGRFALSDPGQIRVETATLGIFRTLLRSIALVGSHSTDAGRFFPVSLTILYRHPRRPDEAGMTVVGDQAKALAMKDQLEHRGYLVIKIVAATFAKAIPAT